ncbi:MAG: O-acetyl-ADP-ribose deacetylase [Candidatus Brockarchaeota archaeon]|nr:O-acetyl-ADP-ribose deacetylase [Candidatus Brockarchaeota archaeon]
MEAKVGKARVLFIRGDITDQETDAIVNAANPSLMGGGGVDGAIHRRGGEAILEECKRIRASKWPNGLPTGEAVITSGGKLKAKHVIHTVGPVFRGGGRGEAGLLARAYANSLKLALENKIKTISFPSISTGAYGYPLEEASKIAIRSVVEFLRQNEGIEEVRFVLFSDRDLRAYEEAAKQVLRLDS